MTIGDRVAFSRNFLRSTFQHTGWVPFARGVIVEVVLDLGSGASLVRVSWDDRSRIAGEANPATTVVNSNNLVREDRIHLEAV